MDKWELLKKYIAELQSEDKKAFEKFGDREAEYGVGVMQDILDKMAELEGRE